MRDRLIDLCLNCRSLKCFDESNFRITPWRNKIYFQVIVYILQCLLSTGEKAEFPGSKSQFTEKLLFNRPDEEEGIPVYRVMDRKGNIIDDDHDPKVCIVV